MKNDCYDSTYKIIRNLNNNECADSFNNFNCFDIDQNPIYCRDPSSFNCINMNNCIDPISYECRNLNSLECLDDLSKKCSSIGANNCRDA